MPAVPDRPTYNRSEEEACGSVFDKIANRRSNLTERRYRNAEILGWASASDGSVQTVEVRSSAGSLLGRASLDISRPDVDSSRSVGFRVPLVVPSENEWQQAKVSILLADGRMVHQPLSDFSTPHLVNIPLGKTVVHFAVDRIQKPEFKADRLWKIQKRLESWYLTLQKWLLWPGVFVGLAAMLFSITRPQPVDLAIAILAVAVASRLIFFAILDASAWQGDQPRYLFAVYPLFSVLLVLLFARVLMLSNTWKKITKS
jgi:hypothetical protein